jgi:hypothetical protein
MRAYGYEDREWPEDEDPHTALHLREATLLVSDADDLLRIQRFISESPSGRARGRSRGGACGMPTFEIEILSGLRASRI